MPPHLLNRELQQVRAMAGWQDPVRQLAIGQTLGAWLALQEVNANLKVVAGWLEPKARIEGGGRVFLRGIYEATAEIAAGVKLFKVPAICHPKATVGPPCGFNATAAWLQVNSAGVATAPAFNLAKGNILHLDGVNWSIN